DRYAGLAERHVAKLRERLQQQNGRSRPHSARNELARTLRLHVGPSDGGINQDVGIEAHHHRLCISSRRNLRKLLPQGSPFAITLIAWSIAFWRSTVSNGGR